METNSSEVKIKVFQIIQRNLAVIGLTPNHQPNDFQKLNSRQVIFVVTTSIEATSMFAYICLETNDIEEYMDIICSITIVMAVLFSYISLIFKKDKGFSTIKRSDEELTHRSNKNPKSHKIHEKTHRLVEKLSNSIYFLITKLGPPGFMLPKAIISYLNYFTTNAGNDAFKLPLPVWIPFDWKNPVGYLCGIIWQFALNFPAFLFLANVISLGIGAILFTFSFAKDWKVDLQTIDKMVTEKQSKADILEQITEFVRSHSNFKQLFNDFEDLFNVCIFLDILCCTINLCAVLLIVQSEIISKDVIDPGVLCKSSFIFSTVFGVVFLSCEIGHRLTNTFDKNDYEFEQLIWYSFPFGIQQILPTILIGVQKPVVFESCGIVELSREQFKRVAKAVYKSFNILRKVFN